MKGRSISRALLASAAPIACLQALPAYAQQAPQEAVPAGDARAAQAEDDSSTGVGDIIVTARKRSESINRVGMSITAATGDALRERGVVNTAELAKIVPGLSVTAAQGGQPVYTIRGVGLFEYSLAATPAVSIYVDQVTLATPIMTSLPPFDLERVEVLKGPQGTLFGANSTGGAINFIAAKPTDEMAAGMDLQYERFDRVTATAFVSGPVSDTLSARVALHAERGGAWQYSLSRPGDELGSRRTIQARALLLWKPFSGFRAEAGITYGYDNSDSQAQQFLKQLNPNPLTQPAAYLALKPAPKDNRAADWPTNVDLRADNRSLLTYLRADYDVTPDITVTSLTAYQQFTENMPQDQSGFPGSSLIGTSPPAFYALEVGKITDFSQELRIAGTSGPVTWTVGANYDHKNVREDNLLRSNLTISQPVPFIPPFETAAGRTRQRASDYAAFANVDFELSRHVTAHAGVRYTDSRRSAVNCTFDYGDGRLGTLVTTLQQIFVLQGVKNTPIVPLTTQCVSLTPAPDLSPQTGGTPLQINQDNVSWRLGLDYRFDGGTLLYASANRGYKSGIISLFTASTILDFVPATQERLDAYEIGFKSPFGSGRYQLNGAVFYYNYKDKQVRGVNLDPIFGTQLRLLNVPRSRVTGAEASFVASPIDGLRIELAGTYLDTKIDRRFIGYNSEGRLGNLEGSPLPYTSRWQGSSDIGYEWDVSDRLRTFIGSSVSYRSSQNATFDSADAPAPDYRFPGYALLDLRAGVAAADGSWRVTVFGKNVTDKFYVASKFQTSDYRYQGAGMPATYGVRLAIKM